MKEAEQLRVLPEEERLVALVELIRKKLKFPYPEVIEDVQDDIKLKEWFEKRFYNGSFVGGDLELNEFLENGYGDCKIIAAAYLVAAQASNLKGIYAFASNNKLKNIQRPDNGESVFISSEINKYLKTGHAWVEIQLSDGRWIPVDPTTNMIGLDKMIEVFKNAEYNVFANYNDEVLPKELRLERNESYFKPGESETKLKMSIKIKTDWQTNESKITKFVTDKYEGNADIILTSDSNSKSKIMDLSFK